MKLKEETEKKYKELKKDSKKSNHHQQYYRVNTFNLFSSIFDQSSSF